MDAEELTIKTARLLLRPFSLRDADEAYSCLTPTLNRFMASETPGSRPEFDALWGQWLSGAQDGSEYVFVIRHRTTDQFLGLAGLHHLHADMPELSILIREDKQGMTFGREAMEALLDWAPQAAPAQHYRYLVTEDNVASRKIAESLGGVLAGHRATPTYEALEYHLPQQRPQTTDEAEPEA